MTAERIEGCARRQVLAGATTVAGALVLGACSGGGSEPAVTAPAPGKPLLRLSNVPVGEARSTTLGDRQLIVARPDEHNVVAFSAVCTHKGCTVAPAADSLRCPCHGSVYETLTGRVVHGPATRPLREVPVRVTNGQVVTA